MRKIQVKIFCGELAGSIENDVNQFISDKDVYKILPVYGMQGGYVSILVFYYTSEITKIIEKEAAYETKIFQGPSKIIEERINSELKTNIFNDINLSSGYGDFLKVILIIQKP